MSASPFDEPDAPAAAPEADPSPADVPLDAPWLEDPEGYSIIPSTFGEVRPQWFCFVRDKQLFVRVLGVSQIPMRNGRVVFLDLADGRSLSAPPDEEIITRRRR